MKATATSATATQKDIDALGEWFECYGSKFWNGEYFDADSFKLYRVETIDEDGNGNIIGYEIRY